MAIFILIIYKTPSLVKLEIVVYCLHINYLCFSKTQVRNQKYLADHEFRYFGRDRPHEKFSGGQNFYLYMISSKRIINFHIDIYFWKL